MMTTSTFATNGHAHAHAADEAIDTLYSWWPGTPPAPAPCPEAALSLTLKGTMGGIEAMMTIRGQSADEFQRNLAAVKGLLDAPPQASPPAQPLSPQQLNALAMHRPVEGVCPIHQVQMIENEKNGQRWYSHRLPEGGFCKGR